MATSFPFVEIAPEQEAIIGMRQTGTRIYRHDGPEEEVGPWFEALSRIVGPTVSPGGVTMFCPVSRAAVHKRAKEGKLSVFLFHVTHHKTTLFGNRKTTRSSPYGYIPISEAKAWRTELEERAVRNGVVTVEELHGARPDWHGKFLEWPDKSRRPGLVEALEELGITSLKELASALLKGGEAPASRPAGSRNRKQPQESPPKS